MYLGVLQFSLAIPYAESLKDKRSVVRSVKDKLRRQYNVSVAEIDDLDDATLATFGLAMVGTEVGGLNSALDRILDALQDWRDARLEDHQIEILSPH